MLIRQLNTPSTHQHRLPTRGLAGKTTALSAKGRRIVSCRVAQGPGSGSYSGSGDGRTDPRNVGTDYDNDWDPGAGVDISKYDYNANYDPFAGYGPPPYRQQDSTPRDKWITPLLDWQAIREAFDFNQDRTEESLQDEALTNKNESLEALKFLGSLVLIPLLSGFLVSKAVAGPVLNFTLTHDPEAFELTDRQKVEGAHAVREEETRLRMNMAIGSAPPLTEVEFLQHLREFAHEFEEEEREHNEHALITVVSDSVSLTVAAIMLLRPSYGKQAMFNTGGRLFDGLSDIAKACLIILVADTLLGYHSEEGWTGLIEIVTHHYGLEAEEGPVVIFVGTVPVLIDVCFKYWIFIGLNKISPSAVVTIKQVDRH